MPLMRKKVSNKWVSAHHGGKAPHTVVPYADRTAAHLVDLVGVHQFIEGGEELVDT